MPLDLAAERLSLSQRDALAARGYVYFILGVQSGLIKIGFSKRVTARLAQLRVERTEALVLVGYMRAWPALEKRLHHRLREHRAEGEWFHPAARVLQLIGRLSRPSIIGATMHGVSVQEWFDSEEQREPGFLSDIDKENLRADVIADLRRLRNEAKVSQSQLAARMGVKQPVIARIESGSDLPDLTTLHRYAHALGYLVKVGFVLQPQLRKKSRARKAKE